VLAAGFNASKSPAQAHDYEMAKDYWLLEFPGMADRTRSSILTYATQILHVFNTGMAKEMIAGETNISPEDILNGKWVLVNFPPSTFGAVGSLICTGWKYLTQLAVLKRKATEKTPFVTIWADESHQFVTGGANGDNYFIAQARSHKGCLIYLTQSVSSFYAAIKGEAGRHQADALLSQFSMVIAHVCDAVSAKWLVAKLGRRKEMLYSGSTNPPQDVNAWDAMFGARRATSSFSEHYEQVLQDQELMIGLTGGPDNGFVTDAFVLKSGEPFAGGTNHLRVSFSQKG
jgi:hypothetical protein